MRLRYVDSDNSEKILAWRAHALGAELLLQGKGFVAPGFSLGVYSHEDIASIRLSFARQEPERVDTCGVEYYAPLYTFTTPVKFAPRQGHETRLAVHAERWRHWPDRWQSVTREPRTVTIHEQGERTPWRWLGRYRMDDVVSFLREGMDICAGKVAA